MQETLAKLYPATDASPQKVKDKLKRNMELNWSTRPSLTTSTISNKLFIDRLTVLLLQREATKMMIR